MFCNKNEVLTSWRGIFSLVIILFHYYLPEKYFPKGYLGVEFFFILSGFFLTNTFYKRGVSIDPIYEVLTRWKRFFPINTFMFLFVLTYQYLHNENNSFLTLLEGIGEILMIEKLGFTFSDIHGIAWYFSALLISVYFICVLLNYNQRLFFYIIAPIFFIITYTYFFVTRGDTGARLGTAFQIIDLGMARGMANMCFGCILYKATQHFDKYDFTLLTFNQKIVLTLIEFINIFFITIYITHSEWDFADFYIFINFSIIILLSWLRIGTINRLLLFPPLIWIGKISLYIYIGQQAVFCVFRNLLHEYNIFIRGVVIIFLCILWGYILYRFIEPICRYLFSKFSINNCKKEKSVDVNKIR